MAIEKRTKPLLENLDKDRFAQSEKENDDRRKKDIQDNERQKRKYTLWPSKVTQKVADRDTSGNEPEKGK